ncbi:MAG TPA: MBL fold metallo-hydrolase [Terriglobales bacterium]|nr:MBL fold metallo-hydrolase [Terriglobales bacterium]
MVRTRWISLLLIVIVAATTVALDRPANNNAPVTLEYLGTAGWKISNGTVVILVDPYLSRINGPAPPGGGSGHAVANDTRRKYGWSDIPEIDKKTIETHITKADYILVTHTHYDHVLDVPYIALRTKASVIGTESTENVLRAYSVPEEQLITVRGGEDYQFNGFSLRVIPSIHSPLDHKRYYSSATAPPGMKAPLTLQQMHPEGGTLGFLIRLGGHQILAFGGNNFIEREITGLQPDVALIGAGASRHDIFDYSGRLMRALNYPPLVLPTHWDNFLVPYDASQQPALDALQSFVQEIETTSPKTRVLIPKYFEAITLNDAK